MHREKKGKRIFFLQETKIIAKEKKEISSSSVLFSHLLPVKEKASNNLPFISNNEQSSSLSLILGTKDEQHQEAEKDSGNEAVKRERFFGWSLLSFLSLSSEILDDDHQSLSLLQSICTSFKFFSLVFQEEGHLLKEGERE